MLTCTEAMRGRASRPTPKWSALLAAILALGGGEAAAQLTADSTFDRNGLKVDVAERVTEGASATITVTVKASVAAGTRTTTTVTVTVSAQSKGVDGATNEAADVSLNPGTATLSFPANTTSGPVTREVSGRIVLQTNHDPDAEDETVVLAITADGGISISSGSGTGEEPVRPVTLDDDEDQSYILASAPGAGSPREGVPFDVVVSAEPVHVDGSKTMTLQIDDSGYALDTDANETGNQLSGTLDGRTTSFTATVTPPANDTNRVDDRVTVTAYSGTVGNATEEAARTFTVADAHALPTAAAVTVEARDTAGRAVTSVAEGGVVDLTISVDRGRGDAATTGEALSVALALVPADAAQASSYRMAPARVELPAITTPAGKQSAATVVRLEALADEFVNDDRLTLNLVTTGEAAYGAGSVDSSFAIAVQDTTVKKVSAKSDAAVKQAFDAARTAAAGTDGLNPGEVFSVAVSDLFEGIAAGSTVVFSASSSDPTVQVSASSTAVMVTAVSAGSATVRVDARVTGSSSVSFAVPQTRSDEAAVEQMVTVVDSPLRVALTADPAPAVEEGGEITLTASANRAVLAGEDATVRLTVVGPVVSPPSSITIAVGATTAAAVLTVQDDDEVKDLGSITVVAGGASLATDPTRLDIAVTEDDVETTYRYTFTAAAARVTEGGAVTLAATATPPVEEETVVALTGFPVSLAADYTIEPASIVIAAGTTGGTAELRATDDDEVEDTETLTVTATGPGKVLIGTVEIMLVDNDAPRVVAKPQAEVDKAFDDAVAAVAGADGWTAGDRAAVLDVRTLFTVAEGAAVTYEVLSSNPAVVAASTSAMTVTLEPLSAGGATISVTATDSAGGVTEMVSSDVTVGATYSYTFTATPAQVTEGGSVTLAVTASPAVQTETVVSLTASPGRLAADYTLEPASITLAAGASSGTARLLATDDDEVEDTETLTVTATGPGRVLIGTVEILLVDNDTPTVVAKPQADVDTAFDDAVAAAAGADGWNAGGPAAVLDARNLFTVAEGATVAYAALSSNPAAVTAATSATTVTLQPLAAGAATITVTAADSAGGAVAAVSAGVTVSAAVVTYTLSGPADPNLVEGRSYELKVTASATATTDATFTLRRDRAASDAGDDDFTLEPASIVITAGATEGTAVLTVADDGVDEGSEALVLFAVTAARDEVGSLTFTLWDAAIPALPLAGSCLLAAFLANAAYRRRRRNGRDHRDGQQDGGRQRRGRPTRWRGCRRRAPRWRFHRPQTAARRKRLD